MSIEAIKLSDVYAKAESYLYEDNTKNKSKLHQKLSVSGIKIEKSPDDGVNIWFKDTKNGITMRPEWGKDQIDMIINDSRYNLPIKLMIAEHKVGDLMLSIDKSNHDGVDTIHKYQIKRL